MKYFFDTEFLEDGKTIELISIGIVGEDGSEFYAINEEAPWNRIADHQWLRENVVPHLPLIAVPLGDYGWRLDKQPDPRWRTYEEIRYDLINFVRPNPEFWAYFADYDWVAFCQIFGRIIDLPQGFPMYCRDIKQWCDMLGVDRSELPDQSDEHNALADAKWNKTAHAYLSSK